MLNRIKGTIFGNALGDAMGLATEFMTKNEVNEKYNNTMMLGKTYNFDDIIKDYHRSTWKTGDWTDDTDQMICLMKSIQSNDQKIFSENLHNWIENGFPECNDTKGHGIGNTMSLWLGDKYSKINPFRAAVRSWIYNPWYPCSGTSNGAVMRTSIVGTYYFTNINTVFDNAIKFCTTTHVAPECVASCMFISGLISYIINNNCNNMCGREDNVFKMILEKILPKLEQYIITLDMYIKHEINDVSNNDEMYEIMKNNVQQYYKIKNAKTIIDDLINIVSITDINELNLNENIGHTYKPVACACISLKKLTQKITFEEILLTIIREGGDADTNCAVTGALLGSYMGFNNLPINLLDKLPYYNFLNDIVENYISTSIDKYITDVYFSVIEIKKLINKNISEKILSDIDFNKCNDIIDNIVPSCTINEFLEIAKNNNDFFNHYVRVLVILLKYVKAFDMISKIYMYRIRDEELFGCIHYSNKIMEKLI